MLATLTDARVPAGREGAMQSTASSECQAAVTGTEPNKHLAKGDETKPEPCTRTRVPPASVPSPGVTEPTTSSLEKKNDPVSEENMYPPSDVTPTLTKPGFGSLNAGATHDTSAMEENVADTSSGEWENRQKVLPDMNPEPLIVTTVPPRFGPDAGDMDEIVGGGREFWPEQRRGMRAAPARNSNAEMCPLLELWREAVATVESANEAKRERITAAAATGGPMR